MKQLILVLSLLVTLIVAGCTVSDKELKKTTLDETKQAFESTPKKVNEHTELFSYYLPKGFTIKKTDEFNVLLEKGKQSYILFVNEKELSNSKVSYETLAEQSTNPFISQTFENQNRFGYLFVNQLGKNKFEVTVGLGGTKVTTESKANDVSVDARNMVEIVTSVQ